MIIINKKKKELEESSLSRLNTQIEKHDCGMLSGFRGHFSLSENKSRNRKLWSMLGSEGYGVTTIAGSYIENFLSKTNAKEVAEESFFVVDLKDTGRLKKDLKRLGEMFLQESIIYIEEKRGYLIGTTPYPDNKDAYPPYGETKYQGFCYFGQSGEFFSRVNNRAFAFIDK